MGISVKEIGKIGDGKSKIGQKITIATIQSLAKEIEKSNFQQNFGTILIDECHHIPSETFRSTINKLHCFYLYGLTATPFRKYNDGKLIFAHIGEIIIEIQSHEIGPKQKAEIVVQNTELDVPFNSKTDKFETLSKVHVHDSARNNLILDDIKNEVEFGKKIVIITERKEHIDVLYQLLEQSYETVFLSGEDSETNRNIKWNILKGGDYQILITIGQFFGEGTDLQHANCLFLVYPFSFEGKLIQYIGRVQRSEIAPTIYDYRDLKIDYLNKLFLRRNTYYRKLEKQSALFEETPTVPSVTNKVFRLDQQIKITINQLEFRYGSFTFDYEVVGMNLTVEFEIENLEIRPEFEVLKPYFTKLLGSNFVKINIEAEFLNEKLVSALATSSDLDRINNEIIESVKFRFVTKNILGKINFTSEKKLMELSQIPFNGAAVFETETELLDNLLKNKNVKHSRNLRYLAQKHESNILKIRFVLSPFSFFFLLVGKEQFHLILETLDTAEATYLWHIEKNINNLTHHLVEIDQQLNIIRNKGRQTFLESAPSNFSRIVHDYTDEKKDLLSRKIAWRKGYGEFQIILPQKHFP